MARRIIKTFPAEKIKTLWSSGKALTFNKKRFKVHKMSYGDYFLEDARWKGGETEGFAPGTIWLDKEMVKGKKVFQIVK